VDIVFVILALIVTGSALAAMALKNLVHCALSVAVTMVGLAMVYLKLGAPFLGWIQILVYVGAVAILIVFAILLTRQDQDREIGLWSAGWRKGGAAAFLLFCVITGCVISTRSLHRDAAEMPELSVAEMGVGLMTDYVVPLELLGVLLTAAMLGAVVLARDDR
jgi:NADH-quinone oxidoreductase subunit J